MQSRRNIILTVNVLLLIVLIVATKVIFAQEIRSVKFPERSLGFSISPSYHIKHSLRGLNIGLNHEIKLNKVLTLHNDFGVTLHIGKDHLFSDSLGDIKRILTIDPDFNDAPLQFITGGIQSFVGLSASIYSGKLKLGAGPLLRYQTTTVPDKYSFFYELHVGQFRTFYHTYYVIDQIHPHTLSAGGLLFLDLKLFKARSIDVHTHVNYQFDSYKNSIFSVGLTFKRQYKYSRVFEQEAVTTSF